MRKSHGSSTSRAIPSIRIEEDGPYLVTGHIPLSESIIVYNADGEPFAWRTGPRFPPRRSYALCRCGRTRTAPWCDGSHARTGFVGTENTDRRSYLAVARRYVGPALELTDAEGLCASAGFCTRDGGTWELTLRSRDPGARRLAIEEAGLCPSGRLVAWDKEGNAIEPRHALSIGLVEDLVKHVSGPIWVRGGIPVLSSDGRAYEARNRVTLCRCGRSPNKPFCDGTHEDAAR